MNNKLRSSFNTRQYMVSSDYEVFYYSDSGFTTLSPHSHNYYECYLFIEGDITMEILSDREGSSSYKMTPGDLMLVPPGVLHHAIINDPDKTYRRFVFWISKNCCNSLLRESVDYMYLIQKAEAFHQYIYHLPPASFHQVESRFLRLLEERASDRYGSDTARHLCLCDLILTINRTIYDEEHKNTRTDELSLFQNILSYVELNLEEVLSLDDIAARFFVSKYYVAHLFKDTLGISLHQFIIKKRLEECRMAIINGESISKTYERFGFRDYSSFFKAFKKEYGMSPKEYQGISRIEIK
ncbi:MAG: AraC family transcriptional regulator [Butyrivibrio sp.]|nr:AraC family transcriptional regulator [Butyrivibrio sp.]